MGSWNGTCAVSNLHVTAGQEVAVFMLLQQHRGRGENFCYNNSLYDVCPIPFYGKYNDYGAVEECHGPGLNYVIEALRSRLYEFGQGPNPYHDPAVNKTNFDIDVLFDADHEGRLGIQDPYHFDGDDYDRRELERVRDEKGLTDSQQFELDRLAAKIKRQDTFRRVTHVIIHGEIFKAILEKWYIEDYVGDGKGNTGYGNNYVHIYFKDIVDSIPEYINRMKALVAEENSEKDPALTRMVRRMRSSSGSYYDDPCLALRWMSSYFAGSSSSFSFDLIDVQGLVSELIDEGKWDEVAILAKEALTAAWINSFMSFTRKNWSKQCGSGSQNAEHLGYEVLITAMQDIIKAEKAENKYWEDDEDFDELDAQGPEDGVVSQEPLAE